LASTLDGIPRSQENGVTGVEVDSVKGDLSSRAIGVRLNKNTFSGKISNVHSQDPDFLPPLRITGALMVISRPGAGLDLTVFQGSFDSCPRKMVQSAPAKRRGRERCGDSDKFFRFTEQRGLCISERVVAQIFLNPVTPSKSNDTLE